MAVPSRIFPWDCRDKEDAAWAAYHTPHRHAAVELTRENSRLKRLLRENGIAWSPVARTHLQQIDSTRRQTRKSFSLGPPKLPTLPMEVVLKILEFSLASKYPIIDPLCSTTQTDGSLATKMNWTKEEQKRENQIAIHFLATCKQLHVEGTRMLWKNNSYVFTSPQALRNFAELEAQYRITIPHITLRVIARYYDDQKRAHTHALYHPDLSGVPQKIRYQIRQRESPLARSGFRCYTWNQVIDFLAALRAPYDPPAHKNRHQPRPRLLPALTSIRIDLINFSDTLLPFSGPDLHDITTHEMGCSLNELQVTGMPTDETGVKASMELSGLLKDEGLYLDAPAAFLVQPKSLKTLGDHFWHPRVVRCRKAKVDSESDEEEDDLADAGLLHHMKLGLLPPAPLEEGYPRSNEDLDKVIWKQFPCRREGKKKVWQLFRRRSGELEDAGKVCDDCGVAHEFFHTPLMDPLIDPLLDDSSI